MEDVTISIPGEELLELKRRIEDARNPKVIFREDIGTMRKDAEAQYKLGLDFVRDFLKKYI